MSVGVDQLADREAVRLLGRCDFGDGRHGLLSLFGCRSVVGLQLKMLTCIGPSYTSLSGVIGRSRIRRPVAWKTASATAASTPVAPSSPMPLPPVGLAGSSISSVEP